MNAHASPPSLRQLFLDGMSRAAATVSVVATDGPAGRAGVTVSAMASVSADGESPTLLVCVHHLSPAAATIIGNGAFCVNVLRREQRALSARNLGLAWSQIINKTVNKSLGAAEPQSPVPPYCLVPQAQLRVLARKQ